MQKEKKVNASTSNVWTLLGKRSCKVVVTLVANFIQSKVIFQREF